MEHTFGNDLIQSCTSFSALIINLQPLTQCIKLNPSFLLAFLVSFSFGTHFECFEISMLCNLKCLVILWFFLIKRASSFKVYDIIQVTKFLHNPNKSFHSHSSAETGAAAFTLSKTLSVDSS